MRGQEFHARKLPAGEQHDELTERVIGAAIEVHRLLGPGLSGSIYEAALCHELTLRGIAFQRQWPIVVKYKGVAIGETRLDLLIEGRLIVELKACDGLSSVHRSQCITYLTVSNLTVALLINFNVPILRDGIKRVVLTR